MRLIALRLAGFKSFVEPTELRFPSELVGIVGPNGCGKSNTLDAIRWVMGESSAKHLRGQALEDVIFAGSTNRKPVAQASVELVFDNSAGLLKGPWARPGEISVRRVLTRDGQSKYYLNGTRCRRKDVADLFLGTGLGARSYAIIEQGQISRLIEARPEELRATLEEAAGISRYKERRRETENSIQHTRENLSRLDDVREELARQLEKLERQAKTAERFRQLQSEEANLSLALHALQLKRFEAQLDDQQAQLVQQESALQQAQIRLQAAQAHLEHTRSTEQALLTSLQQAQAKMYTQGAEVARLEQALKHAQSLHEERMAEQTLLAKEWAQQTQLAEEALARLATLEKAQEQARRELATCEARCKTAEAQLQAAEQEARLARERVEALQAKWQTPAQQIHVEQTRLEHAERQYRSLLERQQRLRLSALEEEAAHLKQQLIEAHARLDALTKQNEAQESAWLTLTQALEAAKAARLTAEGELERLRREATELAAELRALRALDQDAKTGESNALQAWLKRQGLGEVRVVDGLHPDPQWVAALDTVLNTSLRAIPVTNLDDWRELALHEDTLGLCLVEPSEEEVTDGILRGAYARGVLGGIKPIGSLEEALDRRHDLALGEIWLTPTGDQISRHLWRRPPAQTQHTGDLSRRLRLESLETAHAALTPRLEEAEIKVRAAREHLATLERQQTQIQREMRELLRRQGEAVTLVEQLRLKLEHVESRLRAQQREAKTLNVELQQISTERHTLQERLDELRAHVSQLESSIHLARQACQEAEQNVKTKRTALREAEQAAQSTRSHLHALTQEHALLKQQLAQYQAQLKRLENRRLELETLLAASKAPLEPLKQELDVARKEAERSQKSWAETQQAMREAQNQTRQAQEKLILAEREVEQARQAVEVLRLRVQELRLRTEPHRAALAEVDETTVQVALQSTQGLDVEACQARLDETRKRIAKLGAVNLAALEEFEEARERKLQLDAQQADLREALSTLEAAITRMDRETRSRFKETFKAVNIQLGALFQRLFGGGEAYLALTSEDWLEAGVQLMARPPGKKISHIHLLSGGEKSLTAIALIFALFQLNPAPFCLLDEVDAPLDEANVGRFCAMVQDMAERVQFIFITHNKTTMELAHQLIGVTMREPGVSRIVDVDLDEAVRLVETRTPFLQ